MKNLKNFITLFLSKGVISSIRKSTESSFQVLQQTLVKGNLKIKTMPSFLLVGRPFKQ
uniref:Uncharacterized protein n=1 Tax=Rhizophora mucronata TaxID=61149 RepID=A0A2P2R4D0_RHIMU